MEADIDQQGETLSQSMTRKLKEEAAAKQICARCLINAGLRIEVKDGVCSSCGALWKPNT